MKNLKYFTLSFLMVGGLTVSLINPAFAADARALFLSTAGTEINYQAKQNNTQNNTEHVAEHKVTHKVVPHKAYAYRPRYHRVYHRVALQRVSEKIPAGLSIEVLKVASNGVAIPVDPSVYRFRNGDEFAVSFESNTPGYVRVYNINPSGDVNYLGTYAVPAFMRVQLPKNGYFKFTGERGEEKLVFQLYPCRYETNSYGASSSRDIVLTSSNGYGRVSDKVLESLPDCEPTNNGLKVGSQVVAYNDNTMSRDIVLSGSNPKYSSYEGGATYYVDQIDSKNVKPITAVINFLHK
ncbi:hypothetical protein [Hydrogenobaculum acidophilum]